MTDDDLSHLRRAVALSAQAAQDDIGGPFGAVVVRNGAVLGEGRNQVLASHDPTAHAEVVAIRAAATHAASHDLSGSTLYTSCEPCPMCLASAYWARIDRIVFAADQRDAAAIGFDDAAFYKELAKAPADRRVPMAQALQRDAQLAMQAWFNREDRTPY